LKNIKLLGIVGCPTCKKISALFDKIVKENNLEIHIDKIYDMNKILEYDVVSMPGIVVDDDLKISGRIPTEKELIGLVS